MKSICHALLLLLVASQAPLFAQSYTWNGATADWNSANWNPTGTPGLNDSATISSGTVTVSTPTTVASLTLSGGAVTGTAVLTVNTSFNWSNSAIMSGTGSTILPATCNATVNPSVTLDKRTLNVGGSMIVVGSGGNIDFQNGAQLNVQNNATFDIQNPTFGFTGVDAGTLNTSGNFRKTVNAGISNIAVVFNTTGGTVDVQVGALRIAYIGTDAASYAVGNGAVIDFAATRTLNPPGNVTGNGQVAFSAGTVTIASNFNLSMMGSTLIIGGTANFTGTVNSVGGALFLSNGAINLGANNIGIGMLNLGSGTLSGTGNIDVLNALNWNGPASMSGTGSTTVLGAAAVTINSPSGVSLDTRSMSIAGSAVMTSLEDIALENGATFTIQNGATFDCQSDAAFGTSTTGILINNGTLKRSVSTGNAIVAVTFNNNKTVQAQTGTFSFTGTSTHTAGALSVSAGAVLELQNTTLDAASSITGAGEVRMTDVAHSGAYSGTGVLTIVGGTVDFKSPNRSFAALQIQAGTLTGSGNWTVTGAMIWSGGVIGGGGSMTVNGTGSLNIPGTGQVTLNARTLNLNCNTVWNGSVDIQLNTNAVINVLGGGVFDCQNDQGIFGAGGAAVTNAGTFKKSAGIASSVVNPIFTNTGTIISQTGSMGFSTLNQSSGATVLQGGNLAGVININGGTLRGSGGITGVLTNGGTLIAGSLGTPGTIAITGNYIQNAGGNCTVQLAGKSPGTQFGQVTISGSAQLAGNLIASVIGGFIPDDADTFRIMSYGSATGAMSLITTPFATGKTLQQNQRGTDDTLSVRIFPAITSPLTATGKVGIPFTYTITAVNNPTSFGAINLPGGLSVVTSTGVISGTPATAGNSLVALSATSATGNDNQILALNISANASPVIATFAPQSASSFAGAAVAISLNATDSDTTTLQYTVDFGDKTTPATASFTQNTAQALTHTFAAAGTYTVTATVTDSFTTVTRTFTQTVAAGQAPTISDFSSQQNPAPFNTALTIALTAADTDSTTLQYTVNFGDGSAPATGSMPQSTTTTLTHAFAGGGDFIVSATVTDGALSATSQFTQTVLVPESGSGGVPNVSQGDNVTNPIDGLGITVLSSDGGVIELSIDVSNLRAGSDISVSTEWGDINGRATVVPGLRPVHKYLSFGVFVATTTAVDRTTGKPIGKGRKTLVLSARETGNVGGETTTTARTFRGSATPLPNATDPVVTLKTMKGKFNFNGSKTDSVNFSGTFKLPAGFDPSVPHEFSIGIGNIVIIASVDAKGNGKEINGSGALKKLKLSYKLKKGQISKGGELATVNATYNLAGMVNAGFDTEGISPRSTDATPGKTAPRTIQTGFTLDGAAYETQAPVQFTVSKNSEFGSIDGRNSK